MWFLYKGPCVLPRAAAVRREGHQHLPASPSAPPYAHPHGLPGPCPCTPTALGNAVGTTGCSLLPLFLFLQPLPFTLFLLCLSLALKKLMMNPSDWPPFKGCGCKVPPLSFKFGLRLTS